MHSIVYECAVVYQQNMKIKWCKLMICIILFSGQNDIYEIGNAFINGETKCYDPCRYEEINMK